MRTSDADSTRVMTPTGVVQRPCILERVVALWQALPDDDRYIESRFASLLGKSIAMQSLGAAEADYDTLVVVSGLATAFAYHPQRYQPIYVTPDPADDVDDRIARVVGVRWESLGQAPSSEQAWATVRESIDDGRPVLGSWIDDVVFCGYADGIRPEDRAVLVAGGWDRPGWWAWERFDKWAAEFGWMGRPAGQTARADARASAIEVVAAMVRAVRRDGRAHDALLRHAVYGLDGIMAFADDLAEMQNDPDFWYAGWLGGHCIARQVSGRAAAAEYLARIADAVSRPARDRVKDAARAYAEASRAWDAWERALGAGSGATDPEEIRLVWMDSQARRAGSLAARNAAACEREAVALLEAALAS